VVPAATCDVGGGAVVVVVSVVLVAVEAVVAGAVVAGRVVAGRVVVVRGGRVVVVRGGWVVVWAGSVVEVRGGRVVDAWVEPVADSSVDDGVVVDREIEGRVASGPESEQPPIATKASATAPSRNHRVARTRSSSRRRTRVTSPTQDERSKEDR
jgi:hypothetical protein